MQSKQYFTKIKNYPHEKSTEPYVSFSGYKGIKAFDRVFILKYYIG